MELSNLNDFQLGLMKAGLKAQISECASHPGKNSTDILELVLELAQVEQEQCRRKDNYAKS